MNKQIQRLGAVLLLCFAALFVRLNQIQVFDQEELASHPLNSRGAVEDFGEARGDILTADGVVVATSIEVGGQLKRERRYPQGNLFAHVTGYFSFNLGTTGAESVYNDQLDGRDNYIPFASLWDLLAETDDRADLHLTLVSTVQQAAKDALGERKGSVVALDPRTGDVLAMWSWPSYDPNVVSSLALADAEAAKIALDADPNKPLLAKTYREFFAPGSTFKLIAAAAGLGSGRVTATEPVFPFVASYVAPPGQASIGNFGGSSCGGNLGDILRASCNTAFAQMAAEVLGPELMIQSAEAFGFNSEPPIDLPAVEASQYPTDFGAPLRASVFDPRAEIHEGTAFLALTGIGQYEVRSTPLQMALIAAGVANRGEIMVPHVMDSITETEDGRIVDSFEPTVWRRAMASNDADALRRLMVTVVTSGTAQGLAIPNLEVGAKTGTAQTSVGDGPDDTHAWIVAFAGQPGAAPEIAVAVIVEAVPGQGQQTGGTVAAPIARAVIEAAFAEQP